MPDTIVRPGRKLPFTENSRIREAGPTNLNQHADNWTRLITGRVNDLSTHNVTQGNRISVCTLADLPAPVNNVITLEAETLYEVCGPTLDIGNNQIVFGFDSWLIGQRKFLTEMVGNTEVPLLVTNGSSAMKIDDIAVRQNGSGNLAYLDSTITDQANRFRDVIFFGGNIVGVDGLGMLFQACVFDEGVQVIQDGSGGVDIVQNEGGSLMVARPGFTPRDGIFKFESGSMTRTVLISETAIQLANASIGINIEDGATIIEQFSMAQMVPTVFGTGGTIIQVGNPNIVGVGTITGSSPTLLGPNDSFLACQPTEFESIAATGGTDIRGITQDGLGNLIVSDTRTDTIFRYDGISNTPNGSIAAPSTNVGALAWSKRNLYSVDTGTNLIYQHNGFTTTTSSISAPASNPSGIAFVGNNLVSTDSVTNLIYIHEGFSTTITTSFASPATTTRGLAFDGVNLIIGDAEGDTVYVMRGITSEVQYSFTSAAIFQQDIWVTLDRDETSVGFVLTNSQDNEIVIYSHPVTFDHSSSSWDLMDNAGVIESSDRGGTQFSSTTRRNVTLTQFVWTDIAVQDIAYGCFSEFEKMAMFDELSGEIIWLSTRTRGRVISGQLSFSRGASTNDYEYELAIVINDVVQDDSIALGALVTSAAVVTFNTLPISRDLGVGDRVKLQMRKLDTGTGSDPDIGSSKLAIT